MHALFWSGSAKLNAEARQIYDQYLLLSEFGIRPWEVSGEIFREDLAYMLACAAFRREAEQKWSKNAEEGAAARR